MLRFLPAPLMRLICVIAERWEWLGAWLNSVVVNGIVKSTRNRPHPWSTFSDYISWQGLTDRSFQGRHLPARAPDPDLPKVDDVAKLFIRPFGSKPSTKSTCLFPAFAQYLTDGFIRTDLTHDDDPPPAPLKRRKTTTNHEIDMCPLYGRTHAQTQILRLMSNDKGRKGRLKSQVVNGEEYAPFLYRNGGTELDPQFKDLDPPLGVDEKKVDDKGKPVFPPERLASLFAFGGDRVNATPMVAMVNTLFLREHNRLAGELERQNPAWDDERVFQTARNIVIVMFIKIVVEEYINHITPLPFHLRADPKLSWTAAWNRTNWITAEFSLLYRWHSLVPDVIDWPGGPYSVALFLRDNRLLLQTGVGAAFAATAAQPSGELGAFNTNEALKEAEERAIDQARTVQLATYNDYREQFGKSPAESFEDISSNPAVQKLLKDLYGTPDRVEFYPGLFAEDRVKNSPLPELLLSMVAVDAFSQALTNPLMSEHVFLRPDTFTPWGAKQIAETKTLEAILRRNLPGVTLPAEPPMRMTQAGWRFE